MVVAPKSITAGQRQRVHRPGIRDQGYPARRALFFIRLGRPVENGFIEDLNQRLRDKCPNVGDSARCATREMVWFDGASITTG